MSMAIYISTVSPSTPSSVRDTAIRASLPRCDSRLSTSRSRRARFATTSLGRFYEEVSVFAKFSRVLPMNTWTEAVEMAIKLARKWTYIIRV
jgi:acetylornithine/succinyldiaminopimelate/putrescine aminotransferase